MIWQLIVNGIITGTIYGVVALGFALVYNTTRIFHIAYAAIYMIAPYFLLFFLKTSGLPMIISIILAFLGTIVIGLSTELLVYSPLVRHNSSSNVIMVSSIGVMIVIINIIALLFGNGAKIINSGISKSIAFGTILITHIQLIQFFSSLLLFAVFFTFLKFTKFGIQTRAYRDDISLSEVLGMNTLKMRRSLFILSSFFAAIGSCLIAYDVGMEPYIGMPMLLNAVVALIIGGVGRFEAPILGGLLIGILQSLVVYVTSARWQDAITFLLLIVFLLFRPQGIMGEKMRSV
jgi:branched-chain amino acid transport system permease protein